MFSEIFADKEVHAEVRVERNVESFASGLGSLVYGIKLVRPVDFESGEQPILVN
jgi:hypothetical protein